MNTGKRSSKASRFSEFEYSNVALPKPITQSPSNIHLMRTLIEHTRYKQPPKSQNFKLPPTAHVRPKLTLRFKGAKINFLSQMRLLHSLSSNHLFFPTISKPAKTPSIILKMAGTSTSTVTGTSNSSLMWFRKGLRIHDNPALEHAVTGSVYVYPVFVIDPHYMEPDPDAFSPGSSRAGVNRIKFLLESLIDLDINLKKIGSKLLVLKGEPGDVLIHCLKQVILLPHYFCLVLSYLNYKAQNLITLYVLK